jgi:hypothetical protein
MSKPPPAPAECANCGAAIPPHAKACPDCGADERTGWREQSIYDDMDLPDEAWRDDADAPAQPHVSPRVNGVPWYWWVVGAVLLALLVGSVLGVR